MSQRHRVYSPKQNLKIVWLKIDDGGHQGGTNVNCMYDHFNIYTLCNCKSNEINTQLNRNKNYCRNDTVWYERKDSIPLNTNAWTMKSLRGEKSLLFI